jgi:NAD(P)-dependent dehydrogenase (short-subunit alcohol dehydrogenase family)
MSGALRGKTAVVTGANRGIGRAVASSLAEAGAQVVLSGRDKAAIAAVARDIEGVVPMQCDVSDACQVEALVNTTVERHGALDIMVANAGIARVSSIADMPLEQWREVVATNLSGVFYCLRYGAPAMARTGGGSIVTMASVAALGGFAMGAHYAATKAGVVSLTKTAAVEFRDAGVRVNAICPGFVDTDMAHETGAVLSARTGLDFAALVAAKQGTMGAPTDVGDLAVFLASDHSRFATGAAFVLDGGASASVL